MFNRLKFFKVLDNLEPEIARLNNKIIAKKIIAFFKATLLEYLRKKQMVKMGVGIEKELAKYKKIYWEEELENEN